MHGHPEKPSRQPELPDRIAPARKPNMYAGFRDKHCLVACMDHGSLPLGRLPEASSRDPDGIENPDLDWVWSSTGHRRLQLASFVPPRLAAKERGPELRLPLRQTPG